MNIGLYITSSERVSLNKELTGRKLLQGDLKEETSVVDPVIMINSNDDDIFKYNYCHIPAFNRYYYINDITVVSKNFFRLSCHVDVLYTYRNEIKKNSAIICKQQAENRSSNFYDDGSYRTKENTFTEIHEFPNGFNQNGNIVLLTAGAS